MQQPQQPRRSYIPSVPCEISIGDYSILATKRRLKPSGRRHCSSLVIDFPDETEIRFPCPHSVYTNSNPPLTDLLLQILTSQFSTLPGFPQDCVDQLVSEISSVAMTTTRRNHRPSLRPPEVVDVVYFSVGLSLETTAIRVKRATEESIQALEMVGARKRKRVDDDDSCVICLEDLEGGSMTRMPCEHVFHTECIVDWLRSSFMCPLCRFQMPSFIPEASVLPS